MAHATSSILCRLTGTSRHANRHGHISNIEHGIVGVQFSMLSNTKINMLGHEPPTEEGVEWAGPPVQSYLFKPNKRKLQKATDKQAMQIFISASFLNF